MTATILALVLSAATATGAGAVRQPANETPPHIASVDERAPVEVPPPSDRAMAYYRSGNLWWIADIVLSIAVPSRCSPPDCRHGCATWRRASAGNGSPTELLFVMGHEMGHYVLGHVWYGLLVAIVLLIGSVYAAYRTADAVLARWSGRFGFTSLADIASLPLLLLLVSIFSRIVTPRQLAFTRYQEHEADRFGLEMTQTNHSAGTAFVKLQEDALANPRPGLMFKVWRESHPPLGERIDFTNEYHPWRDGRPLAYGDRFKR